MLIDISRPIHSGMAIYPGNPSVRISVVREAEKGVTGLSQLSLGTHTGTHIDTPMHIDTSSSGAEAYNLTSLVGDAQVVEIEDATQAICGSDIPPTTSSRVLIKTKNAKQPIDAFDPDFAALTEDGAQELIHRGVILVGVDGPSIKRKGVSDAVHELFLSKGIVVIEGLWLQAALPGHYTLMCLPLPIFHTDGVPVRAVLDSRQEIDY